jgi:hypothetical protein
MWRRQNQKKAILPARRALAADDKVGACDTLIHCEKQAITWQVLCKSSARAHKQLKLKEDVLTQTHAVADRETVHACGGAMCIASDDKYTLTVEVG